MEYYGELSTEQSGTEEKPEKWSCWVGARANLLLFLSLLRPKKYKLLSFSLKNPRKFGSLVWERAVVGWFGGTRHGKSTTQGVNKQTRTEPGDKWMRF
jgi:hypothetical protein